RPLSVAACQNDCSQTLDVVWKKHRIVEQQLVTIVTVDRDFPLKTPWTLGEDSFALAPSTVLGATEEPFGHVMMSADMRASGNRRPGVARAPIELAPANSTMLDHVQLGHGDLTCSRLTNLGSPRGRRGGDGI